MQLQNSSSGKRNSFLGAIQKQVDGQEEEAALNLSAFKRALKQSEEIFNQKSGEKNSQRGQVSGMNHTLKEEEKPGQIFKIKVSPNRPGGEFQLNEDINADSLIEKYHSPVLTTSQLTMQNQNRSPATQNQPLPQAIFSNPSQIQPGSDGRKERAGSGKVVKVKRSSKGSPGGSDDGNNKQIITISRSSFKRSPVEPRTTANNGFNGTFLANYNSSGRNSNTGNSAAAQTCASALANLNGASTINGKAHHEGSSSSSRVKSFAMKQFSSQSEVILNDQRPSSSSNQKKLLSSARR